MDGVRRVERVVRVHRRSGQDRPPARAVQVGHHMRASVRVGVDQRQVQLAVLAPRRRHIDHRHGVATLAVVGTRHVGGIRRRLHERLVHVEDMIGRCQQHLRPIRQDHRLQHVDHLGDGRQLHPVGVTVEDVQRQRRHFGIAQRVLLIEEAGMGPRLLVVPGAPLIDVQRDFLLGIILVHRRADLGNQGLHLARQVQFAGPQVLAKAGGGTAVAPHRHGVIVEAQRLQPPAVLHHRLGEGLRIAPAADIAGGPAGHLDHAHRGRRVDKAGIARVDRGGIFRRHVAAAAPGLIADAQIFQVPRLVASIGAALVGQRRVLVRGHVLDPLGRVIGRQRADIDRDVRIGADQFGEVHELVGAEGIVVSHAAPMHIDPHRPLVARADAVAPVVKVGEAAAGPADHRHMDFLQRLHHIGAIATNIGDGAVLPNPDAAIDAGTQMFGELAIDMPVDHRPRLRRVDRDRNLCRTVILCDGRRRRQRQYQRRTENMFEHAPPRIVCARMVAQSL